jgi:hypothetical protein
VRPWLAAAAALAASAVAAAQVPATISLSVTETAGIRRTNYPVGVDVRLPEGVLRDPANARLAGASGGPVAAQFGAAARWSDGSIQSLSVDFNASVAAFAVEHYRIEYGPGVTGPAAGRRRLSVTEGADGIQIGAVRLGKSGLPLLASVRYRGEDIAPGPNGLQIVDDLGVPHDFSDVLDLSIRILKAGPLVAKVRYSGTMELGPHADIPFVLDVEIPNSKSWVRLSTSLDDPQGHVATVTLRTPLSLGPLPWTWDIGTDHGTYGALRRADDRVQFTEDQTGPETATWRARAGTGSNLAVIETSGDRPAPVARWAHLQSASEAVAFAVDVTPDQRGTYGVSFDGSGQAAVSFSQLLPATRHELSVYEHFVSTPLEIGAATSPAAVLNPLQVTVE